MMDCPVRAAVEHAGGVKGIRVPTSLGSPTLCLLPQQLMASFFTEEPKKKLGRGTSSLSHKTQT